MAIRFEEKELEVAEICNGFHGAKIPAFHYPVSRREGWRAMIQDRRPVWVPTNVEVFDFYPDIIPDNRARGFVNDGGITIRDEEKGGRDMFGVEWVYVPVAGGSMEKPGAAHLFDDVNDWKERLVWPDIDSWDWEGCSRRNQEFLQNGKFINVMLLNGFGFERLISFMGFEDAAVALVDEEQEDAVLELMDALSDLCCRIVDKCCEYFAVDGFVIHDDWGTQRAPFFSFETGRRLLVPYMKKMTDHIHSKGKTAELHSCGCNEAQIENFIAGGWDFWSPMSNINDTQKLFREYGDRIIISVAPDEYDPETESEEEIRAKARAFAEEFCSVPGKACAINRRFAPWLNGAYAQELYRASREQYAKWLEDF